MTALRAVSILKVSSCGSWGQRPDGDASLVYCPWICSKTRYSSSSFMALQWNLKFPSQSQDSSFLTFYMQDVGNLCSLCGGISSSAVAQQSCHWKAPHNCLYDYTANCYCRKHISSSAEHSLVWKKKLRLTDKDQLEHTKLDEIKLYGW
jgi:hypothetical protein